MWIRIIYILLFLFSSELLFSQHKANDCYYGEDYFPVDFKLTDTLIVFTYDSTNFENISNMWYKHFNYNEVSNKWSKTINLDSLEDKNVSFFKEYISVPYKFVSSLNDINQNKYVYYTVVGKGSVILNIKTNRVYNLYRYDLYNKEEEYGRCTDMGLSVAGIFIQSGLLNHEIRKKSK